jgi:hypothetical protein
MAADVRALLTELGYAVLFREQGWTECLLVRDAERWLGRGRDESEALDDAVRQAAPSHLARVAFERLVVPEPIAALVEEANVPPRPAETLPELESREVIVPGSPETLPAFESTDDLDDPNAAAELRELQAKIDGHADDLAVSNPQRQRLVLLAWIARARSYQERSDADDVHYGVRAVASQLGAFARAWWPGSVPALQLAARPPDAAKTLQLSRELCTWEDVGALAERKLGELEAVERARGFDGFGWADAKALVPPSARAEELFKRLVAEMEEVSGPLGELPTDSTFDAATMLRWSRVLRALRGAVDDVRAWASAAGRLRYLCGRGNFKEAVATLDPAFCPTMKWAEIIAPRVSFDTAAQQAELAAKRATELSVILGVVPTEDSGVRDWLRRALPLATDAQQADVVAKMRPFAETVLALGVDDFAGLGRRTHKRLRKLQEALGGSPASSTSMEAPQSVPEIAPSSDHDRLRARALARTRGKRAVLVSNRIDRDLEARLRELLELDVLDSEEAEPRRVDAVVEAIGAHGYDIVLAATGFLYHTVDAKLSRACHQAGVVYVRANKARPTATLRALAVG